VVTFSKVTRREQTLRRRGRGHSLAIRDNPDTFSVGPVDVDLDDGHHARGPLSMHPRPCSNPGGQVPRQCACGLRPPVARAGHRGIGGGQPPGMEDNFHPMRVRKNTRKSPLNPERPHGGRVPLRRRLPRDRAKRHSRRPPRRHRHRRFALRFALSRPAPARRRGITASTRPWNAGL
jgi:hypothetical protein